MLKRNSQDVWLETQNKRGIVDLGSVHLLTPDYTFGYVENNNSSTQEIKGIIMIWSLYNHFRTFQKQVIYKKNGSYCFKECY